MEHQTFGHSPAAFPIEVDRLRALTLPDFAAFLSALLTTTDQETVWSMTCRFMTGLGFTHVLYGYSPDSRGAVLGAPEDYLVLSTLPQPVISDLVSLGYYRMSSTFNWALTNVGVASWSMQAGDDGPLPLVPVTPEAAEFFDRHDLLHGCTIGFPQERTRGKAVMALIAPRHHPQSAVDLLLDRARDMVFTVAAVAHRCLSSLPYHAPGRRLTERQREVLEWVGEGKTTADIAVIMGITPPTVEKHLRLARETLGVDTTAHALIKAAFLNQVFVAVAPPRGPGAGPHITPVRP